MKEMPHNEEELITVLKPTSGWQVIDLKEIWRYKDLFWFLTLRNIKSKYAQSVLGVGWSIIQPLVQTIIFTIIFGKLAKIGSDGVPYALFSFIAMVPWNYYSNILTDSSNSLITNRNMLSKVYFPRVALPVAAVTARLIDFTIGLVVAAGFMIYYKVPLTWSIFMLPALIILLIIVSLGTGMFLSALAIQYRDINYAMTFMVRLLMYAAPVVYPLSIIPQKYVFWYALNPMVGVIECFRAALLPSKVMPWGLLIESCIVAIILFVFSAFYFRRMERYFADIA